MAFEDSLQIVCEKTITQIKSYFQDFTGTTSLVIPTRRLCAQEAILLGSGDALVAMLFSCNALFDLLVIFFYDALGILL